MSRSIRPIKCVHYSCQGGGRDQRVPLLADPAPDYLHYHRTHVKSHVPSDCLAVPCVHTSALLLSTILSHILTFEPIPFPYLTFTRDFTVHSPVCLIGLPRSSTTVAAPNHTRAPRQPYHGNTTTTVHLIAITPRGIA
jgi:hypothetical protein